MVNYIQLRGRVPGSIGFAYLDRKDYYADRLFTKHGVFGVFSKTEYAHKEWDDFVLCTIWVRRKYYQACLDVFEELGNNMAVMGYTEYPKVCERLQNLLNKGEKV